MLNLYVINYQYESLIYWVWPLRSNSDHQIYYIFNRESPKKPLFTTVSGRGFGPHPVDIRKTSATNSDPPVGRALDVLYYEGISPQNPLNSEVSAHMLHGNGIFYLHSPWIYCIYKYMPCMYLGQFIPFPWSIWVRNCSLGCRLFASFRMASMSRFEDVIILVVTSQHPGKG